MFLCLASFQRKEAFGFWKWQCGKAGNRVDVVALAIGGADQCFDGL